MINKNVKYGKTENATVIVLGTGDVHMVGSVKDENGGVHLGLRTVAEPQPINVIKPTSLESYDEMKPEIVFIFNKAESIDSLINMLKDCKTEMLMKNA